ncbi:MAG TPA: Gx transporter family protein [Limnochordales bacterium]
MSASRRVALFACLLALSLALYVVERWLPPPPVPGAHLGLANGVMLLVLWQWGTRAAAGFGACRVLAAALLSGRLGGPGFWMSVAGAAASLAVMGLARAWARRGSDRLVLLSVVGGVAHNLGQLTAFRVLVHAGGVGWLMTALVPLGALAGLLVGVAARRLLPGFERVVGAASRSVASALEGSAPRRRAWAGSEAMGLGAAVMLLLAMAASAGGGRLVWAAFGGVPVQGRPAVLVEVAGRPPLVWPLDEDRVERLEAGGVEMVLEVRDGRVRVERSTCPERWCVRTGWIDRPGQSVVCVPARTVVTVVADGSAPPGAWSPGGIDAVSR